MHSFSASVNDSNVCGLCRHSEKDHSKEAQCEACANTGSCEFRSVVLSHDATYHYVENDILLCHDCQEKELAAQTPPIVENPEDAIKRDKIVALMNQLDKEVPTDSRGFFNNEITSIVDIEDKLVELQTDNPQFKLAEIVEERIKTFQRNMFLAKQTIFESQAAIIADQRYLNQLVPKLREEEREKFRNYDINYKPVTPVSVKPEGKVRISASERAIADFAKLMKITFEQAKLMLSKAVVNEGEQCTCAETPGFCKVHFKGVE